MADIIERALRSWAGIAAVPLLSLAGLATFGANATTFVLSVVALSLTQILMRSGAADTRKILAAVAALVTAHPALPDRIEELPGAVE